jgi:predicted nucleic acid-binding protein
MRVFLDANVLLDAMLQRPPWHVEADEILRRIASGTLHGVVSALSLSHLFYLGRRHVGDAQALLHIQQCVQSLEVAAVSRSTIERSIQLAGPDFEDSIQLAAAEESKVDAIVTRNVADFAKSAIPVFVPADLLSHLGSPKP